MHIIDTHCHLFLPEFDQDRDEAIQRAIKNGVRLFVLPNVDSSTLPDLKKLHQQYPQHTIPLIGLHPTSVEEDYQTELDKLHLELSQNDYAGIGEIGMDLYWDKTFKHEQEDAFRSQLIWAQQRNLPVVIHVRESFKETVEVIQSVPGKHRGIFHCFTGTQNDAETVINMGFSLGIGGVLTFKNSHLPEVLKSIDLKHLVLETDAPYLAPTPKRGKRNEPAYLIYTLNTLAGIMNVHRDEIAAQTTLNARIIFGI